MSKKSNKSKKGGAQTNSTNTFAQECLSALELQHVIAKAIIESEEIKEQRKKQQQEEEIKDWRDIIGYKDYSGSKWYFRWLLRFLNDIWILIKLSFISKTKINGNRAMSAIIKIALSIFLELMELALGILALFFIARTPLRFFISNIKFSWDVSIINIILAFLFFVYSRIFRMASIEVEKMEDHNYLFGFFTSVTSIISITIAIIAIVRGG